MRKLKIFEHTSLDGVVQVNDPESGFPYGDWSGPYRTPEGLALLVGLYGESYDLLLGRKTYDMWSGFWHTAPKSPMADRLNAATKYVVTHRPESLKWGPVEGITNFVEGVRDLKASQGPDLILCGSSTLTSALIEQGLADEVMLITYPIMMGKGKRFFAEGTPAPSFTPPPTSSAKS